MKRWLQFGGGNIGRALIGDLAQQNGYHIDFVETNKSLFSKLQSAQSYKIIGLEETKITKVITNFSAIDASNERAVLDALQNCSIITTAIGTNNLSFLVNVFRKFMQEKKESNNQRVQTIICVENGLRVSSLFKKLIGLKGDSFFTDFVAFVDVSVDKIVPGSKDTGLDIESEDFYQFALDDLQWKSRDKLKGVTYHSQIEKMIERKLWMFNGPHALIAWAGAGKYEVISDFASHKHIDNFIKSYLKTVSKILSFKYQIDEQEMEKYEQKIYQRMANALLADPIKRVGRGLKRKLGFNERISAPLVYGFENNLDVEDLAVGLRLAYKPIEPLDLEQKEVTDYVKSSGLERALQKYSGIKNDDLIKKIASKKMQSDLDILVR